MTRVLLTGLFLVTSIYASQLLAAPVDVRKLEKRTWTLTESPHFSVLSDAKPKDIVEVVMHLERFRAFSLLLLGQEQPPVSNPIEITVTKNRRTWRSMGLNNDHVSLTSSSQSGRKLIFTDVNGIKSSSLSRSNRGRGVVFRALAFSLFLDLDFRKKVPLWYFRGFASYLAGYSESGDQISIGNLGAMRGTLSKLYTSNNTFKEIDVVDLLSRTSFKNNLTGQSINSDKKIEFSAQAYLLFNYLYADRKRKTQLANYLNLKESELSIEGRLTRAFGKSAEELSQALKQYATTSQIMIQTYNKDRVLERLELPSLAEIVQKKLDKREFWNLMYPRLRGLSDDILSHQEKLELFESVKSHLPEFESILNKLDD